MFTSISLCLAFLGQDNLHCAVLLPFLGTEIMRLVSTLSKAFWYRCFGLCTATSRPHTSTPYTLYARIHIVKERCLAWPRGRWIKTETEVKKVECLLLCLGRRAVLEQAVHEQLLWLFDKFSKVCKKGTKYAGQSEHSNSTSHSIFVRQTPLPLFLLVAEETPWCDSVLGQRKQWLSISVSLWDIVRVTKGKKPSILMIHAFKANDTPESRRKRKAALVLILTVKFEVTVVVPRQTEVSVSVWGKPSELGISLLWTNQRTFIYTGPQALSWRPSTIRSQVGPGSRLLSDITSFVNHGLTSYQFVIFKALGFSIFLFHAFFFFFFLDVKKKKEPM